MKYQNNFIIMSSDEISTESSFLSYDSMRKFSILTLFLFNKQLNKFGPAKSWKYLITRSFFCIVYIIVGALLFNASESQREKDIISKFEKHRDNFLKEHTCVSEEDLDDFIEIMTKARNSGKTLNPKYEKIWTLSYAYFFSINLVTSCGYGSIIPLTKLGKLFCVFYSLVGIPFTMYFLMAASTKLLSLSNKVYFYLGYRLGYSRTLYISLTSFIIISVTILLPALIYALVEPEWGYLQALYTCVTLVFTVGLGGLVPGRTKSGWTRTMYSLVTAHYLLLGVTFILLLFSVIKETPEFSQEAKKESSRRK